MATPFFSAPDFKFNSTDIFGFDEQPTVSGVVSAYQMVPKGGFRTVNINSNGEPFAVFSRAPDVAELRDFGSTTPAPGNRLVFKKPAPFVKIVVHGKDQEGLTEIVIVKLADGTKTSTLAVSVKAPQTLSLKMFTLEDTPHSTAKALDTDGLRTAVSDVKQIFQNQANVTLSHQGAFTENLSIEGDFGLPIFLEDKDAVINGKLNQAPMDFFTERFKGSAARFNVVLSWEIKQSKKKPKRIGGLTPIPGNFCVVDPFVDHFFMTARIAHEMLHAAGSGHVIGNDNVLMSENENSTWRMVRADIDRVNPTGMRVIIDPKFS